MFSVDTRDLRRLERDLETLAKRAVPFAARQAINASAFEARKLWQAEIDDEFTLRNKYTVNSIRVEKARTLNVRTMHATVGSVADYMRTQEFGGRRVGGGKHGAPIPTSVAAGQAMGSQPRTRLVRAGNKLGSIYLRRFRNGSRARRNAVAIQIALKSGMKFVFLELERSQGIFRIAGGRRNPQLRMVWDISKHSLTIPPSPTLGPALKRLEPKLLDIHRDALLEQLRRHRVFGY